MEENTNIKTLVHFLQEQGAYDKFYYNYKTLHGKRTRACSLDWVATSIKVFEKGAKQYSVSTYMNMAFPFRDTQEGFSFWYELQQEIIARFGEIDITY